MVELLVELGSKQISPDILKDPAIGKRLKSAVGAIDPRISSDETLQGTIANMKGILLQTWQKIEDEAQDQSMEGIELLIKKTSAELTNEFYDMDLGGDKGAMQEPWMTTYLHVSKVTLPKSNNTKHAIVSMGPLERDCEIFWRVVLSQDVRLIACLAKRIGRECC